MAEWKLYGILRQLPDNVSADTQITRMTETIRETLLNENKKGQACGGLALSIDCPEDVFSIMSGGVVAEILVQVQYMTSIFSGFKQ